MRISNCTRCRLEIVGVCLSLPVNRTPVPSSGQAGRHACATKVSGDVCWVLAQMGCLGTIRKSDVVDSVRVAVISNRTRCRLEIVRRNAEADRGEYVDGERVRIGDGPGVGRPAAVERGPRRMCVLCGLGI